MKDDERRRLAYGLAKRIDDLIDLRVNGNNEEAQDEVTELALEIEGIITALAKMTDCPKRV